MSPGHMESLVTPLGSLGNDLELAETLPRWARIQLGHLMFLHRVPRRGG